MIKLTDILNEVNLSSTKFPLPFKNGGFNLTGEAAWNKWKQWTSLNRKDQYIYDVLDTIKQQNYQTTQRQYNTLLKWFNSKTR